MNLPDDVPGCQPLPLPIYSDKNEIMIKFISDGNNNYGPGRGFSSQYEIGCGGIYDNPGIISSPYYPDVFPIEKQCYYSLQGQDHHYVTLHFEAFALGPGNNCTASYVRVYDGKRSGNKIPQDVSSSSSNMFIDNSKCTDDYLSIYDSAYMYPEYLIGTFCSSSSPPQIYSSGKYITMMFVTDDSINTGGWQGKYEQREARVACGGLVGSNRHGYIQSNGY